MVRISWLFKPIYLFFRVFGVTVMAVALLNVPARAESEPGEVCKTQSIMTLAWTICLVDTSRTESELRQFIDVGMKEVQRIDEWMSEWKPNSLISQINKNAGVRSVRVSEEAFRAIELSLQHSELTDGAFDITFNAFFGLYNWKKGQERFPTSDEIKRILPLVNYKNIKLDLKKRTVFLKKKNMKIGLGGMGEGWAIDQVFEKLKPFHIQAGYIDASGGVYVWGRKPSGKLWTIGVGDPRPLAPDPNRKNAVYNLYVTDVAVTTAGDTEKFFIKDGRRFHHIIDPKTGLSADRSVQVTTICKTATLCDLVDDGVYILGPSQGARYAEKLGVAAVMIDPLEKVHFTKGVRPVETAWGRSLQLESSLRLQ